MNLLIFIPFFTPILAMSVFHYHTAKFNKLTMPLIVCMFLGVGFTHFFGITLFGLYQPRLLLNYALLFSIGFALFRFKHDFFQAFSIAYCILFINIFYWEIPIYVYTFINTGQFAWYMQLAPLALFPATHLYKHVSMVGGKKAVMLLALGLCASALFLIPVHVNGWVIWVSETIKPSFPDGIMNVVWSINRAVCYFILVKIFHKV